MKLFFSLSGILILNFIANFVLALLWSFPCEMREITSRAMLPTLRVHDIVFVEKISPYLNHSFKRGEVVLFYPDFLDAKKKNGWQKFLLALARVKGQTGESAYFRRVAGLAGDVVEIYYPNAKIILPPNTLTQNIAASSQGSVIKITCAPGKSSQNQKCLGRFKVPEGFLFLIGDNTDYLGVLEDVKIFGRPQFRISDFGEIEPEGKDLFFISKEEHSQ